MKKLIIILALICTAFAFGQVNGKLVGGGAVWADSVKYGTPGDSVNVIDLNMAYDWINITHIGNANSPVDSIGISLGKVRYLSGVAQDTTWGNSVVLRDSAWAVQNTIVGLATNSDYLLMNPVGWLLRVTLLNHRATLATRSSSYIITGGKK